MKYYVTLHDDEYEVVLDAQENGTLRVLVDDQSYDVQLSEVEALHRYSVLINRASFDVVVDADGSELHLQVGPYRLDLGVENERERAARSIGASRPTGPVTVKSVMPGVIRAVMVKAGDTVVVGQALLILEAMKMENEIRAEQDGIVQDVVARVGTPVDSGAPLLTIEPPSAGAEPG